MPRTTVQIAVWPLLTWDSYVQNPKSVVTDISCHKDPSRHTDHLLSDIDTAEVLDRLGVDTKFAARNTIVYLEKKEQSPKP